MRLRLCFVLALLFTISACSVNPVTGERNLNFVSEEKELAIGAQNYAPMRQAQGGDFLLDPELTSYVQQVGQRLAAQAKRELPYEFHILNDSTPNAWALPGGKIVINRGLLTELKSEAELAAVLGHEIVHADAAHGARSMSKGVLTQVGAVGSAILLGSKTNNRSVQQLGMMGIQVGAQLITTKYGRDAERESDYYGMQYMSQAGYNPQGAVELQQTFVKLSEGRRQDWLSGLFASHPPSQERVDNNRETAASLPAGGEMHREVYQRKMRKLNRLKPAYEAHDEGRKALGKGDTAKARQLANKALRAEPREALFHALSGDIFASNKKFRQAEQAYARALQRDSNFFYHHLRRGQARNELKNFAAARTDLARSLELLPTAQAHYLLGTIERRAGRMDTAVKHFQAAASQPNTEAGQKAQREVVRLDLPNNPDKYVLTKAVLGQNGTVGAALANQSPVPLKNIVLRVAYRDSSGQIREFTHQVREILPSQQQTAVSLGIRGITDATQLSQRVAVKVQQAQIAE